MGDSATVLVDRSPHDLILTRSVACPNCTSHTFLVTYRFLGEQIHASGTCLSCGFERGVRDRDRFPSDPFRNQPNQGQVDTPSSQ
jgi:hypothetical protein